jgi:16S rRNA (guanine966-N2)-methyltransferase
LPAAASSASRRHRAAPSTWPWWSAPKPLFDALKKHADGFACPRIELFCCDALKFAPPSGRRFDLIFLDPPYGQGWLERVACRLDDLAMLRGEAVCRSRKAPGAAWALVGGSSEGRAGQVFFHLLEQA